MCKVLLEVHRSFTGLPIFTCTSDKVIIRTFKLLIEDICVRGPFRIQSIVCLWAKPLRSTLLKVWRWERSLPQKRSLVNRSRWRSKSKLNSETGQLSLRAIATTNKNTITTQAAVVSVVPKEILLLLQVVLCASRSEKYYDRQDELTLYSS